MPKFNYCSDGSRTLAQTTRKIIYFIFSALFLYLDDLHVPVTASKQYGVTRLLF